MKRQTLERYLAREFPVLIEGKRNAIGRTGLWGGYTPNFLRVAIAADPDWPLQNRIRRVRLDALDTAGEEILARPVPE